jgi:hypothetical protein
MRYTTLIAALAFLGAATACTDDDPVEAGLGSAAAVITDDASTSGSLASNDGMASQSAGTFSGSFTSDAQVSIAAEGGAWIDLGSPARVTVALQSSGEETAVHASTPVPAGTYTRVRLTLSDAEAYVAAGGVLGGLTLTSQATIRVGSGAPVVIEKHVQPFTVDGSAHARIRFDLNSQAWIHQQSAEQQEADEDEVRENTTATRTVEQPE